MRELRQHLRLLLKEGWDLFLDEDGQKIAGVDGQLRAERPETMEKWKPGGALVALNFSNVQFSKFGSYAIDILVNGSSVKTLSLEIVPRKEQQAKV